MASRAIRAIMSRFFGETLLPSGLIRERGQDLGRDRILFLRQQRADLFEQPGHDVIL
jgi:hypothetical protein